ncbi:MIP family Ig-specific serine endopeptidase [Mycoplasma sp. 480]|uniref:MIP family Ig-specific serine endopeptidase n=1 Tax=Mycoplasma sp. 480 TaxID=3440155 RepID=UPI003F514EBC
MKKQKFIKKLFIPLASFTPLMLFSCSNTKNEISVKPTNEHQYEKSNDYKTLKNAKKTFSDEEKNISKFFEKKIDKISHAKQLEILKEFLQEQNLTLSSDISVSSVTLQPTRMYWAFKIKNIEESFGFGFFYKQKSKENKPENPQNPPSKEPKPTQPVTNPKDNLPETETPKENPNNGMPPYFDPSNVEKQLREAREKREREDQIKRDDLGPQDSDLIISESEAYNEILDRSFAISFNSNGVDPEDNQSGVIANNPNGTAWLLDYAWKNNQENSDELVLFLATNAHVYQRAYNALDQKWKTDFPDYFSKNSTDSIESFNIGFAPKNIANNASINNLEHPGQGNKAIYYTNATSAQTTKYDDTTLNSFIKTTNVFDNPKTVFVATNFFDDQTNKKLVESAQKQEEDKNKDLVVGKDFAVFSLKIHYNNLKNATDANLTQFKTKIDNAIAALKNSITRSKGKNNIPNVENNSIPYLDIDYASQWLNKEDAKINQYNSKNRSHANLKSIYIAGYPSTDNQQFWMRNYSKNIERDSAAFAQRANFTNGQDVKSELDNNRTMKGIGYQGLISNSGLFWGSSGSLALNEYGIAVGIFATTANKGDWKDISGKGGVVFLTQYADDAFYGPAHNLIDGSNKQKYPKQTKSYKENLTKMKADYEGFTHTALFPEGV